MINGKYIVDKSGSLNFMFVNCNKIDNVTNKMVRSERRLRDRTYSPVNHKRKLISGIIHDVHMLDINKEKIVFNSCKVVLNAIIYKGSKFK